MLPVFATDWFSPQIPVWERVLAEFKRKPFLKFIEIGSWEGRSTCWLLENILTDLTSSLTCIDIFTLTPAQCKGISEKITPLPEHFDPEKRFDENIAVIGAQSRTIKLKGESRTILRFLPIDTYDCVYIDGSHAAVDVLTDAVLSWGLLKKEGILIFDDYKLALSPDRLAHPAMAIDAFLEIFTGRYQVLEHGWQVIIRKIA
jgi:predicted O-methyltransferase YrrM